MCPLPFPLRIHSSGYSKPSGMTSTDFLPIFCFGCIKTAMGKHVSDRDAEIAVEQFGKNLITKIRKGIGESDHSGREIGRCCDACAGQRPDKGLWDIY